MITLSVFRNVRERGRRGPAKEKPRKGQEGKDYGALFWTKRGTIPRNRGESKTSLPILGIPPIQGRHIVRRW